MRIGLIAALVMSLANLALGESILLVLNKVDNELAFVDPDAMKVIAKEPTGVAPHEVCVTGDNKLAIVANYGDAKTVGQSLTVIDVDARTVLRTVDTAPLKRPHGLVASADGK